MYVYNTIVHITIIDIRLILRYICRENYNIMIVIKRIFLYGPRRPFQENDFKDEMMRHTSTRREKLLEKRATNG